MRGKIRNAPRIPDHEVLRKIGGGSYGEVWLAKAVTGVMRAVKVVWRDDFENDRDFEREFEGIQHYEPISRNHPGFIPILHVGRTMGEEDFYYYVMELADDIEKGQEFHPVEYTPRTLRSDLKYADGTPIDVDTCLDLGVKLGKALHYLHDQSLAHRDIKPANVVFHNNEPKLADIGLVAMPGQRSFVGTEGFIPPEGPGTRRADIYSLGKVLYEMATGMDRLDFPNLPAYDFPTDKSKRWEKLNTVLCDVCDPREPHRDIKHAPTLVAALQRIQDGKKLKKSNSLTRKVLLTLFPVLLLLSWGSFSFLSKEENVLKTSLTFLTKEYAPVKILSSPSGAEVWTTEGEFLGTTPLAGREAEVGTYQQYEFRLAGYSNTLIGNVVAESGMIIEAKLPVFAPPEVGETWTDLLGLPYAPVENAHISKQFINKWALRRFLAQHKGPPIKYAEAHIKTNDIIHDVALMRPAQAHEYCAWLTRACINEGYLTSTFKISPLLNPKAPIINAPEWAKKQGFLPFNCKVERIPYASLIISTNISEPIMFYIDGELMTPIFNEGASTLKSVQPGTRELTLEAEGYRKMTQSITLKGHEVRELSITLEPDRSVIFEQGWLNSLDITMSPVGKNLMVSSYEITVKSYHTFIKDNGSTLPAPPPFSQTPLHPIVNISRPEAQAFCAWLTERERKLFFIGEQHTYRLPTDQEWSALSGLDDEQGDTPSERDVSLDKSFVWGEDWIPTSGAGNFADQALALQVDFSANRSIPGYKDNVAFTAPVGQFPPNKNGLHDLAGNVYEWVSDPFGLGDYGVTRGGSWKTYQKENLYRSFRNALKPTEKNSETGFRIVLSKN